MNLRICATKPVVSDEYCIPYTWLTDNAVHLFVASNSWDNLHVELSDDIPADVLKYMVLKCNTVTVQADKGITDKIVNLLCELYEDKAGKIRKAYMMNHDVLEVVR